MKKEAPNVQYSVNVKLPSSFIIRHSLFDIRYSFSRANQWYVNILRIAQGNSLPQRLLRTGIEEMDLLDRHGRIGLAAEGERAAGLGPNQEGVRAVV